MLNWPTGWNIRCRNVEVGGVKVLDGCYGGRKRHRMQQVTSDFPSISLRRQPAIQLLLHSLHHQSTHTMKTQLKRFIAPTSLCSQCRYNLFSPPSTTRLFSSSSHILADEPSEQPPRARSRPSTFTSLYKSSTATPRTPYKPPSLQPVLSARDDRDLADLNNMVPNYFPSSSSSPNVADPPPPPPRPPVPHHLHIYAHKHNTHITLTTPRRQPLISVSTGNLHFRKAQRGTYDAAYQLGKYVMERINQQGILRQIESLEVVLRDFGPGREALTKVLLGSEGRALRDRVVRVADATRLKFGGTRSKKPRRL